jgi:hypothetical protein
MPTDFTESQVAVVSGFLQRHMKANRIASMVPDDCAELLAKHGMLPNDVGPKKGFNFRQMLRDGRDGLIPLVTGARQSAPHRRWHIERIDE